jgi:ABC-type lipoprotein export system ATPase subunit
MDRSALSLRHVSRTFEQTGGEPLRPLRDVCLEVAAGQAVAVTGRSGSGKSTLLHLAAGIDLPTSGEVRLLGRDLATMSERDRTLQRREAVGLVFQFFHLLPQLSVLDNVILPALIAGDPLSKARERGRGLLERVELGPRAGDLTEKLSGGEMQRVALCRALLRRPALVLADEPTGNLDDANGRRVMELLLGLTRDEGRALVYVTHSREMAGMADEARHLHGGVLEPA